MDYQIFQETSADQHDIAKLNERIYGPGLNVRAAHHIRKDLDAISSCSFVARVGSYLAGSVKLYPILIANQSCFLLGPLSVDPAFRGHGIGYALIEHCISAVSETSKQLIVLIGDYSYYKQAGFMNVEKGNIFFQIPVDPDRILYHASYTDILPVGTVRPNYNF